MFYGSSAEKGYKFKKDQKIRIKSNFVKNDEDFGMKLINDDERKVPEWLQGYIDYEAYGRDEAINRGGAYSEYGYIELVSGIEDYYKGAADIPEEDLVLLPDDKKMAENISTLKDVLSATDAILSEQKQTAEVEDVTESVTQDISEELTEELEEPDIEHGIHM